MYCPNCGSYMADGSEYCRVCGVSLNANEYSAENIYNQKEAKSAKNLGVTGMIFAFLLPIVTYIVSGIGLSKASKLISPEGKSAKRLNIAALIIAVVNSVLGIILFY